jgi:RNA polymerase sigma factor (sigma-70 family)
MSEHDQQHAAGFEALVRPHFERMYRLAFRLTASKPEADDLFQDVLVKVFPRFEELLTLDQPGPWLCRVMYNHFIDNRRRFQRQRLLAVSEDQLPGQSLETLPGGPDPALDREREDNIMQLNRALAMLSEEHRLVVLLHDAEGYKLSEIQELMDVPVGTLKSRLHRARARLREILEGDGTLRPL